MTSYYNVLLTERVIFRQKRFRQPWPPVVDSASVETKIFPTCSRKNVRCANCESNTLGMPRGEHLVLLRAPLHWTATLFTAAREEAPTF